MPSTAGSPYEVLVVMNENQWKSESGKALFDMLGSNTPGIAQSENMFDISRINPDNFTDVIRITRNIVIAEISDIYSGSKITYKRDVWASPQVVIKITAPDNETFLEALEKYKEDITEFIVSAEISRQIDYYKKFYNTEISQKATDLFGVQVNIPSNLIKSKESTDFFWASSMSTDVRQDIIIYSYPYTDPRTFTKEFLLQKRDSILKKHIPGPVKGSYMATEYKFEPTFKEIWKNKRYCSEIRGWWKVEGDLMGGPFITHSQLDEINHRVITIEGFVYAPGYNKRNYIRQLEAVVYSIKLPQDIKTKK